MINFHRRSIDYHNTSNECKQKVLTMWNVWDVSASNRVFETSSFLLSITVHVLIILLCTVHVRTCFAIKSFTVSSRACLSTFFFFQRTWNFHVWFMRACGALRKINKHVSVYNSMEFLAINRIRSLQLLIFSG